MTPERFFRAPDGSNVLERPTPPIVLARIAKDEASPVRALGKLRAIRLRERVADLNAMDAPFSSLAKERFQAAQRALDPSAFCERSEQKPEGSTELDPSITKGAKGVRETIEIDVLASRAKKMKKAVLNSARYLDFEAHSEGRGYRWRPLFVTLTYRGVDDWKPGHIGDFRRSVRDWFRRAARGVRMRMVWTLELQQRGAVHYHCLIWVRSIHLFPNPAKAGWWPHGFAHIRSPKGGIKAPVMYMAKYASKFDAEMAGRIPKGARTYGVSGLQDEGKRAVRWWRAPLFAREHFSGSADVRKVKGGYMDKLTGEFLKSEWHVEITPAGRIFAWRDVPITAGVSACAAQNS